MDKLMYDAFEEIREFIVYNDIDVNCKDDLLEVFVKMKSTGYFDKVKKEHRIRDFRRLLSEFAKIYEEDREILDTVLIINGPRVLLEKLEKQEKRKC